MPILTISDSTNSLLENLAEDKSGTYREPVYLQREKRFFHLLGEDPARTVLTYNLHADMTGPDGKSIGAFRTPSTLIDADDFTAETITFENAAGPIGQALAIRIDGDRAVFRNCRFLGWQDKILANRGRHYFTNCYVASHVDFIFGGATAFFDHCNLHCLKDGYIPAASTPDNQPFGFVIAGCVITAETADVRAFLGHPWRAYASVTLLDTSMSEVMRRSGWDNWREPAREKTARFAEYRSSGPGANSDARVKWARQLSPEQAKGYALENVLRGHDNWNPRL